MTEKSSSSNEEIFSKYINESIKYISSNSKLTYLFRQDVANAVPYLRAIHSKTIDQNDYKEFVKAIDDDYKRITQVLQNLNINTLNTYLRYLSAKYYSDNMDLFAKHEYKPTPNVSGNIFDILYYDFDDCLQAYANDVTDRHSQLRLLYEDLIQNDPKAKAIADKYYLTNKEKIDEFSRYYKKEKGKFDPSKSEELSKALLYLKGPHAIIRADIKTMEKELREDLSYSLIQLISLSKETGYYEKYKTSEKLQFKQYDLESYINNSIDIAKQPNVLDNLSINELFLLNSFWQNRVTKEVSNYSKALFTLFDLDIIEKTLYTDDPLGGIDDETIEYELLKIRFLNQPTNDFYKKTMRYMKRNPDNFINQDDNKITINTKDFVERTTERYEQYYNDFFNRNLYRDDTSLKKDIEYYSFLSLPIIASYQLKSDILLAPVSTQFTKMSNSGIIIDDPNFFDNLSEYKKNNTLLLFGIDGKFSFPAFIHMRYNDLSRFYFGYNKTTKVPIYIGHNDFKNHFGVRLSPQIITPISNKQTQEIKKLSKKKDIREDDKCLYQHLYHLSNSNYHPDHFKGLENLYLDFLDAKIYEKNKDGEYTLVDINKLKDNPVVFSPIATPNYSRTKYSQSANENNSKNDKKRKTDDDIEM